MMNLFAREGHKVTINQASIVDEYRADKEHVKQHLQVGKIYTVDFIEIRSWGSEVYLKEVPHIPFNTAYFDDYKEPTTCEHLQFETFSRIGRLTDESGKVERYVAEIKIQCYDCKEKFSFVGLPAGASVSNPTISADGLELRAPIIPDSKLPTDKSNERIN